MRRSAPSLAHRNGARADAQPVQVLTYLYDPERYYLPASIALAGENAVATLEKAASVATEVVTPASAELEDVLEAAVKSFVRTVLVVALVDAVTDFRRTYAQASLPSTATTSALLYLFISHALLLPTIPLASRAQRIPLPTSALSGTLEPFLSGLYSALAQSIAALPLDDPLEKVDFDGRVFYLLLLEVLNSPAEQQIGDLLGPTVHAQVEALWSKIGQASVDLNSLRSAFPSPAELTTPLKAIDSTNAPTAAEASVLPFSNPTLDPYLESVHVSASETPTAASIENQLQGQGSNLGDEPYWENPKPVLPTHLGGPPPAALDARQRKKRDRKEQRFSTVSSLTPLYFSSPDIAC